MKSAYTGFLFYCDSAPLYTPLDDHGAWKTMLAKEMRAAGLKVDADKVLNA